MIADIEYDNEGNAFFRITDEILAETGWQEGDTLYWIKQDDDSWVLTNVKP